MEIIDNIQEEIIEKCKILCSDYLSGEWSKVSSNDFKVNEISGGFVNTKYSCELATDINNNNEPRKVIIHFHGDEKQDIKKFVRLNKSEIEEAVIAERLGFLELGPQVLGVFEGGRVEEYIDGKSTKQADLRDEKTLMKIAKHLAKFHSLSMPLKRNVPFVRVQHKIFTVTSPREDADKLKGAVKQTFDHLVEFGINKELQWINKHLVLINSPIVFSHNDLNGNNIMLDSKGDVKFVDWDYSAYNYRGYDLGYFYLMKDVEILREGLLPRIKIYKKEENFKTFLKAYLNEKKRLVKINSLSNEIVLNDYENLQMETEFFSLSGAIFIISYVYMILNLTPIDVLENRVDEILDLRSENGFTEYLIDFYRKTKISFTKQYEKILTMNKKTQL